MTLLLGLRRDPPPSAWKANSRSSRINPGSQRSPRPHASVANKSRPPGGRGHNGSPRRPCRGLPPPAPRRQRDKAVRRKLAGPMRSRRRRPSSGQGRAHRQPVQVARPQHPPPDPKHFFHIFMFSKGFVLFLNLPARLRPPPSSLPSPPSQRSRPPPPPCRCPSWPYWPASGGGTSSASPC